MWSEAPRIGVVGATGAVGREALAILAEWGVPADRVSAFASARSAGTLVPYGTGALRIGDGAHGAWHELDLVLQCAPTAIARTIVPRALDAGAAVVDASSAYRDDPDVPLVVPGVNGHLLDAAPRLIASPNCSTILLVTALDPIRRAFGIASITVSTYQAVSGAGAKGLEELRRLTRAALDGIDAAPAAFAEPCAFNCFSHNSPVDPTTGLNVEERKMIDESRKIWDAPGLRVNPTCIRVPVERAHSESVTVVLSRAASTADLRTALSGASSVCVVDDPATGRFPTPRRATGADAVLVGRIRPVPGAPTDSAGRSREFALWLSGDQLRKGAALNALQIAHRLSARCAVHVSHRFP
jgi:aspartate-semialdehyde dehydrogenase